ncbi:MAG: NUDIX hydrolase [Candidatus Nanohaloarchaea archaeon]
MKKAVALVVYRSGEKKEILSVLRPEDDEDHPGMWGMPATSLEEDESWEGAVIRAGREKLGVEVEIRDLLSEGRQEREDYDIVLRNYEVDVAAGEPDVDQDTGGTTYVDWKWKPVEEVRETASEGDSLCTSLLLDLHGLEFDVPDNIISMEHLD